jgi:hypothetical protein
MATDEGFVAASVLPVDQTWAVARRRSPDGSRYTAVARAAGDQLAGHGECFRGGLSSTAEHRIVAPKVTGSKPVGHPNSPPGRGCVVAIAAHIGGPRGWPPERGWRAGEDLPNVKHRTGARRRLDRRPGAPGAFPTLAHEALATRVPDPDAALQRGVSVLCGLRYRGSGVATPSDRCVPPTRWLTACGVGAATSARSKLLAHHGPLTDTGNGRSPR